MQSADIPSGNPDRDPQFDIENLTPEVVAEFSPEKKEELQKALVVKHMINGYFRDATRLGIADPEFVKEHQETMLRPIIEMANLAGNGVSPENIFEYLETLQRDIGALLFEDPKTGLLNQRGIWTALETKFSRGFPRGTMVLYLDLNNFKTLNDTKGHAKGDEALTKVGEGLKAAFQRKTDILAHGDRNSGKIGQVNQETPISRLGGDEFLIVIPPALSDSDEDKHRRIENNPDGIIERARAAVNDAVFKEYGVSAAVGCAMADGKTPIEEIIKHAEGEMYRDKGNKSR